jgi:NADP-dependent 3-hydroxy acid dehydrogenase YdfG
VATKHVSSALADSLRDAIDADRVRVLDVFVEPTASARQQEIRGAEGKRYAEGQLMQPDDVAAMVMGALALPLRTITEANQ